MSKHKSYNYLKQQEQTPVVEPDVIEEVVEAPEEVVAPEPKEVVGIVTACVKLNVRTHPSVLAAITTELKAGSKVMIDEGESTEDFYKVCTEAGVEGFCMKKFISVK